MTTGSAESTTTKFPPDAKNSFRFSLFNALNFQITLGAPMILYAKALGGSATTIGIVASLAPLTRPLVERKGKPFETAIRDVVIMARLKLYGRFFNR